MRTTVRVTLQMTLATAALANGCTSDQPDELAPTAPTAQTGMAPVAPSAVASMYAIDFVATAATGFDLNDRGDVVGRSYTDPGCGAFCLPPQDNVVWRSGARIVLPLVAGFPVSYTTPSFINNAGRVAGVLGSFTYNNKAVTWVPSGAGYAVTNLGTLPGMNDATVVGLDEQDRLVGWALAGSAIPTAAAPYMWSPSTGIVNLRSLGYPNDMPAAMSPGGKVATTSGYYQLGNPASVVSNPPPPLGFSGGGVNGSAINDAGDQALFMVRSGSQNLVYPFRLSAGGTWQQISTVGTGHLSRNGMGSINGAQDITLTILGSAAIAAGPTGLAQGLSGLVSAAYPGVTVTSAGPMNGSGQILAQVMIGQSKRLAKLAPTSACGANCMVASQLVLTSRFVEDPAFPGQCFQGGKMYNLSNVSATITSETGSPLPNAQVTGRFLDDYWTNHPVTGTTNAAGVITWSYKGPPCVGAVAFLIDNALLGTRTFDRTRGTLDRWVIPTIGAPANQPPVAAWSVSCQTVPAHTCTFTGSASRDPDGTIASYQWTNAAGGTVSTQMTFTRTFARSGTLTWTLTVTDNGGKTAQLTRTFTVP